MSSWYKHPKGNKQDSSTSNFVKPEEYIDLAGALYKDGQTEKSLAVLSEASQRHWPPAQRGILLNQLAHFHFNVTGKHDEALAFAYEAVSALSAQSVNIESEVALIHAESLVAHSLWDQDRIRASEAASDALSRIEHLIPTLIVAREGDQDTVWQLYYAASRLQALSGQLEKAIESGHRAVALAVEEDQKMIPLVELGCILRAAGRNAEAKGMLNEALRWRTEHGSQPNPRIHHELALVERAVGNREEARKHIDKAMEIVRNNVCMRSDLGYWKTLHFDLSEILRELGELPKEAQVYRDLIGDLREDDEHIGVIRQSLVRCEHELALVERALGNREEARTHIDKAIEIVRSDVYMRSDLGYWKTLHVELSYIFRELGETSKEAQIYRDLIGDLGEDDEDIWVNRLSLARCETELSRFEAAREIFDVIQRSAPSRELREMAGKEMIRLRYRIALRYYEMGEYETSIKGSEAILALCEVDPELHASLLILLGNGYAMLKKYAQARRFWNQVTASPSARRDQRDQAEESLRRLPPRGVDVSERIH